jgi:hypothetical protein
MLGNGGYSDGSYSGNSDFESEYDRDYSEDSDYEENGSLCYESSIDKRSESHGSDSEKYGSDNEEYGSDIELDYYDILIADQ